MESHTLPKYALLFMRMYNVKGETIWLVNRHMPPKRETAPKDDHGAKNDATNCPSYYLEASLTLDLSICKVPNWTVDNVSERSGMKEE